MCVEFFALIWIYLYGGVWRADPKRRFPRPAPIFKKMLIIIIIIVIIVNPCPVLSAKGKDIVKAAYLGGVVWIASLSSSPRPLCDSFTVQMTLRERSMEKLKNQNQMKLITSEKVSCSNGDRQISSLAAASSAPEMGDVILSWFFAEYK